MKVLFFTNMYPDEDDQVKGLFVKNQLDSLVKMGLEVDYCHVKVINPYKDYLKGYMSLRRKLKEKKYDIIHAHYGFIGFLASFQKQVPFVLTLHGSDVNIYWQRLFSKFASIFAKKIIVTNIHHKELFGGKAILIPTGIDNNIFYPIKSVVAKKELNLNEEKKYIVFPSSRKRKVKNYPLFNSVMNKLKSIDPTFEELLLEDKTPEQVNFCFNSADVLLLTSFSEGSPLVIREALLCNLPVVSVDVGDVSERLKNFSNCYVVSNEIEEIVDKILSIIKIRGAKAINKSHQTLTTLDTNAKSLIELYKSFV